MWQMIKENIETGKAESLGQYASRKQGLQYARQVLDNALHEVEATIDDRDSLIADFYQCGGKMAITVNGWQFYLSKRMFDVWGKRIADPHSAIRVNGKAKWTDPDGGQVILVVVDDIVCPDLVKCHYFNGAGEVECPWHELTAA